MLLTNSTIGSEQWRSQGTVGGVPPNFSGKCRNSCPLHAFSLLLCPKMRLWPGLCPGPGWKCLQRSTKLLTGGEGTRCPSPRTSHPAFNLRFRFSVLWASVRPKSNVWVRLHTDHRIDYVSVSVCF